MSKKNPWTPRMLEAGDRKCPVCKTPLGGMEYWPGHVVPTCGMPECAETQASSRYYRNVGKDEIRCSNTSCQKYVAAGSYDPRQKYFHCSAKCFMKVRARLAMGNTTVTCGCGCGVTFKSGRAKRTRYFFNREHAGRYRTAQILARCGPFLPEVSEYLDGFVRLHYRRAAGPRLALAAFCEFLNVKGIAAFEDVTPKVITEYVVESKNAGRNLQGSALSALSTFFNWQLAEERRSKPNPVISSIHRTRQPMREPRPYSDAELGLAWKLLEERGTSRARLVVAIAEESGLRIGEIANLRVSDVDEVKQRLFVRLPNKTNRTRYAPFGENTRKYLGEWLAERRADCGHDHLLHNTSGAPASCQQIRLELQRILCAEYLGHMGKKKKNASGMERWSTHRLRHTMATRLVNGGADAATVMAVGGWKTHRSMCGYSRVDDSAVQKGYETAMKKIRSNAPPAHRRKSLADYLQEQPNTDEHPDGDRCA